MGEQVDGLGVYCWYSCSFPSALESSDIVQSKTDYMQGVSNLDFRKSSYTNSQEQPYISSSRRKMPLFISVRNKAGPYVLCSTACGPLIK